MSSVSETLSYLGALTLIYLLSKLAAELSIFLYPSKQLTRYLHPKNNHQNSGNETKTRSNNAYALVTGATDGMGLAFARELCTHGFNLILHGRNPAKLNRRKEELAREFPSAHIRTWCCDVVQSTSTLTHTHTAMDELVHSLRDEKLVLTVLVNNVGGIDGRASDGNYMQRCEEYSASRVDAVMDLNARFMAQLTRALLPVLRANAPGLIANVSSFSAQGIPYISVYSGTKAFVEAFSTALDMELRMEGVDVEVLALRVGEVRSTQHNVATNFFIPTTGSFVKTALERVGCGKVVVKGYWRHWLQILPFEVLPEWVRRQTLMQVLKRRGSPKSHAD